MIMNFKQQGNIETFSRSRGGWCKKVTGVDKTQRGGYSILGEFIKLGNFDTYLTDGVYLDVSKSGRGKEKPDITYHLFRVDSGEITLLKKLENPENDWTLEFWDLIEKELNGNKVTPQSLLNLIHEKTDDKEVIDEFIHLLTNETLHRPFMNHIELKAYMYDIPCLNIFDYKEFFHDEYDGEINWSYKDLDVDKRKVNTIFESWFKGDAFELGKSISVDVKEINNFDIKSFEFRRSVRKLFGDDAGIYFTRRGNNAVGSPNRVIVVMCGFNSEDNVFVVRHFDYYD